MAPRENPPHNAPPDKDASMRMAAGALDAIVGIAHGHKNTVLTVIQTMLISATMRCAAHPDDFRATMKVMNEFGGMLQRWSTQPDFDALEAQVARDCQERQFHIWPAPTVG